MNREENREKRGRVPFFSSLQMKYAVSYLTVFLIVVVLLNTYPLIASQDLLFNSELDSLKNQATVMSSALMELESLSSDQVVRVMNMLDDSGADQVLVTDPAGMILYDSTVDSGEKDAAQRAREEGPVRYALKQEIVRALQGSDVFCAKYENAKLYSVGAMPIVYRGMIIGCIYIGDVDEGQGTLLDSLQKNLRNISIGISVVAVLISTLFSKVLTSRIGALLSAIQIVGEGEYGHRLQDEGQDEMALLAREFNNLTDRLQTTEEVRRRFVADASHELKTPLASIQLLSDSILESDQMEPELVREFVSDIGAEAQRLTHITEHLLTLSKLDSLPAARVEPVDVTAVLDRVCASLRPVAEQADVGLEWGGKPGCAIPCTGDELYQVIYNLVENAIKYNVPGGVVRAKVTAQDDQILLEVRDTGIGIPQEDITKVFNRFYRVDKARSRAKGGTGLGLSIVRDCVRRYGGWVTAAANSPQGSVFTVGFPRYVPEQEAEE